MECEEAAVCAPLDPEQELLRMVCWIGRDAQLTSAEQVEERAQLWVVLIRQALELFEEFSVETEPAVSAASTDWSDVALAETCLPEHAFIADDDALLMTLAEATLSNGRELSWIDVSLTRWFARCLVAAVSRAAADGQSLRRVGTVDSAHVEYDACGDLLSDCQRRDEDSTG